MAFDVEGARKAGYSDTEIADHLAASAKFDAAAARKSGYSDQELISHLTAATPAQETGLEGHPEESFQAGYAGSFPQPAPRPAAPPAALPAGPARGGLGDPGTLSGAVVEGWQNAPSFWTSPEARQRAAAVPVAGPIYAAGGDLVGGILGAGNALLRGVQYTAADLGEQVGNAVPEIRIPGYGPISGTVAGGPGLGRDVAALPEAFPTGIEVAPETARYAGGVARNGLMPPSGPPAPRFVQEFYGEPVPGAYGPPVAPKPPTPPAPGTFVPPGTPQGPTLTRINELIQADIDQAARRPAEIPPTTTKDPATGEVKQIQQPPNPADRSAQPQPPPGQQPAGAQITPAGQATITPEQAAAYGSTADKQWLYKSVPPGEINDVERIPGIIPTLAQREQTAVRARETKAVRNLSPEADQAERELLDEHNTKRKNFFQETAGSDVTQDIAIESANKNIEDGLAAAFRGGGQVDPGLITAAIQAERDAPSGKLPPVKAVMTEIEKALQKSDGSGLETDPRQVYGVRRVINYLQSKRGLAENPGYGDRDVQAALIRVKAAIDGAMEPAAPGFGKAISDFAEAQRAIEAREALQAKEPKLYDDKGRMQFSKLHTFMNEVVQSRDPRAPLNPYQSLTEAQMNRLKSLHDDLMYVSSAEDLAKARGSDTAPNMLDAVKRAAQGLPGTIVAGVAGHVVGGPVGAVIAPMAKGYVESAFSRRAERAATSRMEELLRPNPQLYPTRQNPLGP